MAIDPKLVSIKTAGELPVSDPSDNANFLFYEGEALKRSPMSNIYDKVSSGLLPATTATVPSATGFERYIVHTAGTYTNFLSGGSPIVVTAADLDVVNGVARNEVVLEVNNGVGTKRVRRLMGDTGPAADPAKLPLYSAIKGANIAAGTQFVDDENGNIQYRVKTGQTLLTTELPANVAGLKTDAVNDPLLNSRLPFAYPGYYNKTGVLTGTAYFNTGKWKVKEGMRFFNPYRASSESNITQVVLWSNGVFHSYLWGQGYFTIPAGVDEIAFNALNQNSPVFVETLFWTHNQGLSTQKALMPEIQNKSIIKAGTDLALLYDAQRPSGTGVVSGKRLSALGIEYDGTGMWTTNFIPVRKGQVEIKWNSPLASMSVILYDANKTPILEFPVDASVKVIDIPDYIAYIRVPSRDGGTNLLSIVTLTPMNMAEPVLPTVKSIEGLISGTPIISMFGNRKILFEFRAKEDWNINPRTMPFLGGKIFNLQITKGLTTTKTNTQSVFQNVSISFDIG